MGWLPRGVRFLVGVAVKQYKDYIILFINVV